MNLNSVILLGGSHAAREIYWFLRETHPHTSVLFVDEVSEERSVHMGDHEIPLVTDWNFAPYREQHPDGDDSFRHFLIGVSAPHVKRHLVERALAHGLEPAPTLVASAALVRPDCELGPGGIVIGFSILTSRIRGGAYCWIADSTIGSDTDFGDYVTIHAGAAIGSRCVLEDDVVIGSGGVVREDVRLAKGVVGGAQCCITKDILQPRAVVVGVPGRLKS